MTLQEAMESLSIMTEVETDDDPAREEKFPGATHYRVTFRRPVPNGIMASPNPDGNGGHVKFLTTQFSVGSAWKRPPTPLEVFRSVIDEARDVDCYAWSRDNEVNFCEWAESMGYNTDSRKDFALWNALVEAAHGLGEFLDDHDGTGDRLAAWLADDEIMDEFNDDNPPIY